MSAAVPELAAFLRRAQRQAAGLSAPERRRVFELCLAHRLRDRDRAERQRLLRELVAEFGGETGAVPEGGRPVRPEPAPAREGGRTLGGDLGWLLGRAAAGSPDRRAAGLKEAEAAVVLLRSLAPGELGDAPLSQVVTHVANRLATQETAVERAAQELTDRLIEAFDPETAKGAVRKGVLTSTTAYKASLYDALCEKFSQLRAYHERGRLVRDFRSMFRKYLRQMD